MNDNLAEPAQLDDVIPPSTPQPPLVKKIEVTDEDKERYFKSFLSDEPYQETFARLGGKVKITLRTLTVSENYDIFKQIDLDRKTGRAKNEDSYLMTVVQYRLGVSLVSVNDVPFADDCTKEDFKTDEKAGVSYVAKKAEALQGWPVHKLAGFVETFNYFETKVQQLTAEVADSDFWKAAA